LPVTLRRPAVASSARILIDLLWPPNRAANAMPLLRRGDRTECHQQRS